MMLLTLVLALTLTFVPITVIAQVNQASGQSSEAGEIGQEFDVSREGEIVEQVPQAAPALAPAPAPVLPLLPRLPLLLRLLPRLLRRPLRRPFPFSRRRSRRRRKRRRSCRRPAGVALPRCLRWALELCGRPAASWLVGSSDKSTKEHSRKLLRADPRRGPLSVVSRERVPEGARVRGI